MDNITENLLQLADKLDKEGKVKSANAVDDLIQSTSLIKVAQYVGVIGYVLKQNRAMANCVRKKRAQSNTSMQEVVLDCLREYQDGQSYNDDSWTSKYAQVITQKPELFDQSHLVFLQELGITNNIADHIKKIEHTAEVLKDENTENLLIEEVLSNLDDLGDIMKKEARLESQFPFKTSALTPYEELAAPQKGRSFWSRFFNPQSSQWWNPFSWSKQRQETGQNQETKLLMDNMSQNLTNLMYNVQRMKLDTSQLKMHMNDPQWLNQFNSNLKVKMSQLANALNPNDWQGTTYAFDEIERSVKGRGTNPRSMPMSAQYLQNLRRDINNIYEHMRRSQEVVRQLGRQESVIGRDLGSDRSVLSSPYHEYDAMNNALMRVYQNPLNEHLISQSERMFARLDDRLRGIRTNVDLPDYQPKKDEILIRWFRMLRAQGMDYNATIEEISKQMNMSADEIDSIVRELGVDPDNLTEPITSTPTEESMPESAEDEKDLTDDEKNRINNWVQRLIKEWDNDPEKLQEALLYLRQGYGDRLEDPKSRLMTDEMNVAIRRYLNGKGTSPIVTPVPESTVLPKEEIATKPEEANTPETVKTITPKNPEDIAKRWDEDIYNKAVRSFKAGTYLDLSDRTNAPPDGTKMTNKQKERIKQIIEAYERQHGLESHEDLPTESEEETFKRIQLPTSTIKPAEFLSKLVKTADIFDELNQDLGDMVDYIIDTFDEHPLPALPEYGKLIVENQKQTNKNKKEGFSKILC